LITSSVILDIVIAAIVLISLLIGRSRGLFRTLAELLSYIVSWIISSILANALSVKVVEWLRPVVEGKLQQIAADMIAGIDLEAGLDGLKEALPEELGGLLANVELDRQMLTSLEQALQSGLTIDVGPYVEQTLQNVAYMISFIVLFIVVMMVLRLLIRVLDILTKLPVIHQLNAFGGAVAGVAKGLVLVLVLLWLSRETGLLFSQEAAARSYIVPYLQGFLFL